MQHPPNTVKIAFELASDVEKQLQVTDSFKLDFPTYPSRELNEMSAEEASGDEQEVSELTRGKRWEIIQVTITKNALISIIITTAVTNSHNNDHRKTDRSNSGHKSQGTQRSP